LAFERRGKRRGVHRAIMKHAAAFWQARA
jgi:hypothetical protein